MSKEFFATVYAKPYCRVGTFAVGMGLGYFLHSTERRVFFRKVGVGRLFFTLLKDEFFSER